MNKKFGFLQGRLSIPLESDVLQYMPENWESEFSLAKILNFSFIEYFNDREKNSFNPLSSYNGVKNLKKKSNFYDFKNYSLCDDFFINNNILAFRNIKKYYNEMLAKLRLLNIRIYILPLFEASYLKKDNYLKFKDVIVHISKELSKNKIYLAIETNLEDKFFFKLLKECNTKNIYLVYDTGNRLKKKINSYNEIINFGKKIIHVHIKDKDYKGKNVVLGTGKVNFFQIFRALKKINYKKNFSFETNRGMHPFITMKNNLSYIFKIIKDAKYKI
jgi:hypothetical protein